MLTRGEKIRFLALRTFGNFFVLIALYGMITTFGPIGYQEALFRYRKLVGVQYVVAGDPVPLILPDQASPTQGNLLAQLLNNSSTQVLTPVDTDFGIIIPKIGANARVIPNVDAGNHDEYIRALNQGVAHAAGTALPGVEADNRNVYLFAHSTDFAWNVGRYNALFYLLKELEAGDEIDVFFEGKRFIYIVAEKRIVKPSEVEYITQPTTEEQLTLQTCWPPGTTLERLLVIAKPKGQS